MSTPILLFPLDTESGWNKCKVNCLHNIRQSWVPQQTRIKSASLLPKTLNLWERNNKKKLKVCWITACLEAYCARGCHTSKYDETSPEFFFLFLFKMDWGKWDYFISFWAEMTCLNSSFRNIFCLLPVADLPSYSCLQGKLGVLLWLRNARILQYHHPWLKLWGISAFSTEHNSHTMCVRAWQCCHPKLWLSLCFYLPLWLQLPTHSFSASEQANTPQLLWIITAAPNSPASSSCWFTGLNLSNYHWVCNFWINLISKGVVIWKKKKQKTKPVLPTNKTWGYSKVHKYKLAPGGGRKLISDIHIVYLSCRMAICTCTRLDIHPLLLLPPVSGDFLLSLCCWYPWQLCIPPGACQNTLPEGTHGKYSQRAQGRK